MSAFSPRFESLLRSFLLGVFLAPGALAALEALRQEDTLPAAFALDDACLAGQTNSETGGDCDLSLRQLRSQLAVHAAPNVSTSLPLGHPSATKVYPKLPGFTLWLVE
ncbi:unnamed protein product, partial [Polarella glacialis]